MIPTTYGLGWNTGLNGLTMKPIWTVEPDISATAQLCRTELELSPEVKCEIHSMGGGSRNKVYRVDTDRGPLVLRVALPLDPEKVRIEVVTMDFVGQTTTIPVPEVISYDTSNNNLICFPWILMEMAEGTSLALVWRAMSVDRKIKIIKQLAGIQAQLATSTSFNTIGGLDSLPHGDNYRIGRMATDQYHLEARVSPSTFGPHQSSLDWITGRLNQFKYRLARGIPLPNPDVVDDKEACDQRCIWERQEADRILNFLSSPQGEGCYSSSPEPITLFHSDLHAGNVFIDEHDTITSILDWEFLSVVPGWKSHALPAILSSRRRDEEPNRAAYNLPGVRAADETFDSDDWVGRTYARDREQYELTLLRPIYLAEMDRLIPGWSEEYESTKFHRVLERHITCLERDLEDGGVKGWLEAYRGDGRVPVGHGEDWPRAVEETAAELFDGWIRDVGAGGGRNEEAEEDRARKQASVEERPVMR